MHGREVAPAIQPASLPDVLERVLDKGIVIAGDIKIKLVDIELLSLQIRLMVCSVDKAREMGMDWWVDHPAFSNRGSAQLPPATLKRIEERLTQLEAAVPKLPARADHSE